jgi:hypothetical protein
MYFTQSSVSLTSGMILWENQSLGGAGMKWAFPAFFTFMVML